MRLKLFPDQFWVVDKSLEKMCENMTFENIATFLSPTVLQNCPQCYTFRVRAKVFTYQIKQLKQQKGND